MVQCWMNIKEDSWSREVCAKHSHARVTLSCGRKLDVDICPKLGFAGPITIKKLGMKFIFLDLGNIHSQLELTMDNDGETLSSMRRQR